MHRFMHLITAISRVAVWIGGAALIVSAAMVAIDVALRNVLGVTIGGADEIAGYIFGISTAWAFSFTVLQRANVRIDAFVARIPRRARGALDLLGVGLLAAFAGAMTYRGAVVVADSFRLGSRSITPLQIPLAVPQALWLAGWTLLFLTCALLVLRGCRAYLRRDDDELESLVGLRDTAEVERPSGKQVRPDEGAGAAGRRQ